MVSSHQTADYKNGGCEGNGQQGRCAQRRRVVVQLLEAEKGGKITGTTSETLKAGRQS